MGFEPHTYAEENKEEIFDEYFRVLAYLKFKLSKNDSMHSYWIVVEIRCSGT